MPIEEGRAAPAFTLIDQNGDKVALKDFRGRDVIVYFYPKDDTPGCTKEACGFRDLNTEIQQEGAVILGISPDQQEAHERFTAKYELPFTLLSDPDHAVAGVYGAWGEKKLYGKTFMGVLRTTYVINEEGVIESICLKVRPKGHAEQILQILGG